MDETPLFDHQHVIEVAVSRRKKTRTTRTITRMVNDEEADETDNARGWRVAKTTKARDGEKTNFPYQQELWTKTVENEGAGGEGEGGEQETGTRAVKVTRVTTTTKTRYDNRGRCFHHVFRSGDEGGGKRGSNGLPEAPGIATQQAL